MVVSRVRISSAACLLTAQSLLAHSAEPACCRGVVWSSYFLDSLLSRQKRRHKLALRSLPTLPPSLDHEARSHVAGHWLRLHSGCGSPLTVSPLSSGLQTHAVNGTVPVLVTPRQDGSRPPIPAHQFQLKTKARPSEETPQLITIQALIPNLKELGHVLLDLGFQMG